MRKQNICTGIAAFSGLFVLIIDSKTAFSGAMDAIQLCIRSVIPALFPFFLITSVLTDSLTGYPIPILHPLCTLFHIPKGAESLLISGFLGGYPVGAQAVADLYRKGQLSRTQAEQMLPYCSNPGPSFLFGIIAAFFPDSQTVWVLWGIIILSSLLVAKLFPPENIQQTINPIAAPNRNAMQNALKAIGSVCGWIVVFRVVLSFLNRWFLWKFPVAVQTLLIGFLELSNGCYGLTSLTDPGLRFLVCGCTLSFGGLCVTLQTASVIGNLSIKYYFVGKCMQTVFCLILCIGILYRLPIIFLLAFLIVCIPVKHKNSSRFPQKAIV